MKINELEIGDRFWMSGSLEGAVWVIASKTIFGLEDMTPCLSINLYLDREVKRMATKLKDLKVGDVFIFNNPTFDKSDFEVLKNGQGIRVDKRNESAWSWPICRHENEEVTVKSKKMNVVQAFQALKDGKKVREVGWEKGEYIYLKGTKIYSQNDRLTVITEIADIEEQWEEYISKDIEVKLNDEYTAVVSKDKIVVGCQEFPLSKVEELVKAVKKVKES